ncbi:hypothetical protein [Psychrobacter sp. I-STPA6b]|uniref:hypothetical protein n=1 Tax=Psychrobacter sp. I-STPA6b TaxID=2585718 RepID=UPI001D0CBE07|nr:hypothetical protein [Psychrobacter sp. I-STPA6b]
MSVIKIEDHQPHIVIEASDGVHVVPIPLVRDVINGSKQSEVLTEPLVQAILKDWLVSVGEIKGDL